MGIRTDLALEARELWQQSAGETTRLSGVKADSSQKGDLLISTVEILNEVGSRELGKPVGTYVTLEEAGRPDHSQWSENIAEILGQLMQLNETEPVLVVGLGNDAMTPDAVGPLTLDKLFVTRHLVAGLPQYFGDVRPVSAMEPGVLGSTGLESMEIVKGIVETVKPGAIIAVDALASSSRKRLCTTVQLTDTGIVPGSGVSNSRAAFSRESLGVPVYAVGVPTVMDAGAISAELGGQALEEPLFVTPREIDTQVAIFARRIADGINRVLFPQWSSEEIAQFLS